MSTITKPDHCTSCLVPGGVDDDELCPTCALRSAGDDRYAAEAALSAVRGVIGGALDYVAAKDLLGVVEEERAARGRRRDLPEYAEMESRQGRAMGLQIITLTEADAAAVDEAVTGEMMIDSVELDQRLCARDFDWLEATGVSLTACAHVAQTAKHRHLVLSDAIVNLLDRLELKAAERVQEDLNTEYHGQSQARYRALRAVCRNAKKAVAETEVAA